MVTVAKRMVALSQTLLVLCVLSGIAVLRWRETTRASSDVRDLGALATMSTLGPAGGFPAAVPDDPALTFLQSLVPHPNELDATTLNDALVTALAAKSQTYAAQHVAFRDAVAAYVGASSPIRFRGKDGHVLLVTDEVRVGAADRAADELWTAPFHLPAGFATSTVANHLAVLRSWSVAADVCVATALQPTADEAAALHAVGACWIPTVVDLSGPRLRFSFTFVSDGSCTRTVQGNSQTLFLSVATECNLELSYLDLLSKVPGVDISRFRNIDRDGLLQLYGTVPIERAVQISSDQLSSAYRDIDILGFSVSSSYFCDLIAILLCVVSISLALLLRGASTRGSFDRDADVESVLYPALVSRVVRLALWLLLPVVAIAASIASSKSLARIDLVIDAAAAAVVVVSGVLSLRAARKLWGS